MCVCWLILLLTVPVSSQVFNYNCPPDWVTNDNTCYKFVYSEKLTYEQSRTACADMFASLVSVDSFTEHNFIETYLMNNDYYRNTWYTRGIQDFTNLNTWYWDGDTNHIPYTLQYWLPQQQNVPGIIIVYKYSGSTYGWSKAARNSLLSYICEIPQSLAFRLTMEQRTFEYGVAFNNLTNIERGPVFKEQPKSLIVVSRTPSASLECRASCNPRCDYKWFKGLTLSEEVTIDDNRYTMTNGKFTIQNPDSYDSADYQCRVSNKIGTILSNPVKLSFGSLGHFSNVQDAPVYATEYNGGVIHCSQINIDPAATYLWYVGNPPDAIITATKPNAFISSNGRLYYSEIYRIDAAEYYCQVSLTSLTTAALGTSQAPSRISRPIRMIVEHQAAHTNWGPQIQDDFIYVSPERPLKGYTLIMECFAYGSGAITWTYMWSRPGRSIPSSAKFTDYNRIMTIENAQTEDEGIYVCTVARGTTASDQKELYLRLYAIPYHLVPLRDQHVDLGSDLTWKCEASGYPYPVYEWYYNGVKMQNVPGEISVDGNTLTIFNLQSKHNGMYQCAVTNYLGTTLSEAQLRVLSFKPSFDKNPLPVQMYGAIRGNITIMCRPEAAPAPLIEWYFGASKISISDKFKQLPIGDLVITRLSLSDAGIYRCKAINDLGEAESAVNLLVKSDVTISIPPALISTAINNETIFIRCEASYEPDLDLVYVWNKNGQRIDIETDFYYEQETKQSYSGLRIKMVQFKHEGMYECIAKTPVNEARASGFLRVYGPPDEPSAVTADSTTANSLMVHWFVGDTNGLPVEYYSVQHRVEREEGVMSEWSYIPNNKGGRVFEVEVKPSPDENQDRRSYLVKNLKPGNIYQFRVSAKNGYNGISPVSYPSGKTKTIEDPPIVVPARIYGGNGSVGDLHIIWTEMPYEDRGDHASGGYVVYWRLYEEGNNDRVWNKKVIPNWKTTDHVELVGIDNYYLPYEVKVQGYNQYGRGPNASAIVYSSEGMPTAAPANVLADGYNATAMEVTWNPVPDTRAVMKGRLHGYQINYYSDDDVDPVYKRYIRYPGQMDSAVVIGLWADSNFWFQIQVYNTAGLGPASDSYKQETLHLASRLYPTEVHVFSRSSSSVLVTWRGILIEFDEATVAGYRLYLWPSNEHFRTAEEIDTDTPVNSYILTNLEKSIIYALRIASYSDGGEGKKSSTIYFTLTGGANVAIDQTLTEFRAGASMVFSSFIVLIASLLFSMVTWL